MTPADAAGLSIRTAGSAAALTMAIALGGCASGAETAATTDADTSDATTATANCPGGR